jgi:hypothetical protein
MWRQSVRTRGLVVVFLRSTDTSHGWLRGSPRANCSSMPSSRHGGRIREGSGVRAFFKPFRSQKLIGQKVARFRQINLEQANVHHDALEFPDGQVVKLTRQVSTRPCCRRRERSSRKRASEARSMMILLKLFQLEQIWTSVHSAQTVHRPSSTFLPFGGNFGDIVLFETRSLGVY